MDKSFSWVKKIINSINSPLQIECCENLISLFEKKYYSEDEHYFKETYTKKSIINMRKKIEKYLSQSSDTYDLEQRMRELDQKGKYNQYYI